MAPFKITGMNLFIEQYGPLHQCQSSDGHPQLWPSTEKGSVYDIAMDALSEQNASEVNIACKNSEELIEGLDVVSGLNLPSDSGAAWVLAQRPTLATVFSMLMALRSLQVASPKPMATWAGKNMNSSVFLVEGFGRQLVDLEVSIKKAEHYRLEASSAIDKVETLCGIPSGEDKQLGDLLVPGIRRFSSILDAACSFRTALTTAAAKKGGNYIGEQVAVIDDLVDKDWPEWLMAKATRSNFKIKSKMLVDEHKTIPKKLDELRKRVQLVSAAEHFLNVSRYTSPAAALEHSGRLYVATSSAVLNTVVKKAMKIEESQLKRDIRVVIKGMYQMRLWTRQMPEKDLTDDGKEVVAKACHCYFCAHF